MSLLYTTTQLVAQLQARLPMGLASQYCMDQLNQAYQWLEQQGAFVWNITNGTVSLPLSSAVVDCPVDLDPGKVVSLYPQITASVIPISAELPYVPVDELANHQIYHLPIQAGVFSCYSIINQLGIYRFRFAPVTAVSAAATTFILYYHRLNSAMLTPLAIGADYFPTPNAFDIMLVDLAESEIKRIYSLSGFDTALAKAQASAALALDKYRSPKRDLAGLTEQTKEVQEKQLGQAG